MSTSVPVAPAAERSRSLFSWWGDRGVRVKVLAPVAVAAAVAGTIGVLGIQALGATQDRINGLYADVTIPIADLGANNTSLERSNFLLSELLLNTDPAALQQVQADIGLGRRGPRRAFAAYIATDMTGREEARDGFAAALDQWRSVRDGELVPLALSINQGNASSAAREAEAGAAFDEASAEPRRAGGHRGGRGPDIRRGRAERLRIAAAARDRPDDLRRRDRARSRLRRWPRASPAPRAECVG